MISSLLEIKEKSYLNYNVMKIVLYSANELPEMNVSSYIKIFNDENQSKSYTPLCIIKNEIYLIIKIYQDGTIAEWISKMDIGSKVNSVYFHHKRKHIHNEFKNVLMIAGGTGIAPMYQMLYSSLCKGNNTTKYTLINLNKTDEDVFLKEELDLLKPLGIELINCRTRKLNPNGKGFVLEVLKILIKNTC